MKPVQIKVKEKKDLLIKWSDGTESVIPVRKLRRLCPCASCISDRERQSKSYIPIYIEGQTTIVSIGEVGSYAIQIFWKDGHNTGIYEFPYLRNLAENL